MKIDTIKYIFLLMFLGFYQVSAQLDSGIKTVASYNPSKYYGGNPLLIGDTSGDGRFFVFESNENIATVNPRNADKNWEIFLMDYAQRHIFQITNTKHALETVTGSPTDRANILVYITNLRARISNDGKWIAFVSNATSSTPSNANSTNPGNFDGNSPGTLPIIQQDANTELWIYQIPSYPSADLSSGILPAYADLGTGTFTQATNSLPISPPVRGDSGNDPRIETNNDFPSIDDTGLTISFISDRNYANFNFCAAPDPPCDNNEVFIYKRLTSPVISQVTRTPRIAPLNSIPINQRAASISGDGSRVVFQSNGNNPIIGMTSTDNNDFSEEVFVASLNGSGAVPTTGALRRQVTNSTINTFDLYSYVPTGTRNISRDGRYVVLYSTGKLDSAPSTSDSSPAVFLFDCAATCTVGIDKFRRVGPRFHEDATVPASERGLYSVTFTDYNVNREPGSLVFESRMNFRPDGVVPSTSSEGLNPQPSRPRQIFAYSIPSAGAAFSRLTNSQNVEWGIGATVAPGNTKERINFLTLKDFAWSSLNLFQLLTPNAAQEDAGALPHFFTGAGALGINTNPSQAQGLMRNMLGSVAYSSQLVENQYGVAEQVSNSRNLPAPLQLKGISLTIDGLSANITGVSGGRINFIVPKEITPGNKLVVINHRDIVVRGSVQINQSAQPDIVRSENVAPANLDYSQLTPRAFGRARILDVTDPSNPKTEPFKITTQTSSGTIPTKLRLFLTGVQGVTAGEMTVRFGNVTVPNGSISNPVETDYPGIFSVDFDVPAQLNGAGHVTVTVMVNGVLSRPAETAPRTRFISTLPKTSDLAVWRPGNGVWYILDENGQTPIYVQWGSNGDVPAPGDYDGDGKIDFCIFRPSTGDWWFIKSSDNSAHTFHFGSAGDQVAQADYDGDGKTDFSVYRPSNGIWYVYQSSNNQTAEQYFGITGDKIVPADYDGDGHADLAVWRKTDASFWVKGSLENIAQQVSFGLPNDEAVVGDFDGDGRADFAVWRPGDNVWYIYNRNTGQVTSVLWGSLATDIAVQGDYDGDGKTDIAVWRKNGDDAGWWYIRKSATETLYSEKWGQAGDVPVPARW